VTTFNSGPAQLGPDEGRRPNCSVYRSSSPLNPGTTTVLGRRSRPKVRWKERTTKQKKTKKNPTDEREIEIKKICTTDPTKKVELIGVINAPLQFVLVTLVINIHKGVCSLL